VQEESFTLAGADGGFIDVVGAEALRSEFERLFFDPTLSLDQILGMWESNEQAREAIEQLFGPEALASAVERARSAESERKQRLASERRDQPVDAAPERTASIPHGKEIASQVPDPTLAVSIKPTWSDQRVFRYYRASLAGLQTSDPAEIALFRTANAAVEAWLRRKLPHWMEEIDFLYGSRTSRGAGEGLIR
jgi:hypothetical protein